MEEKKFNVQKRCEEIHAQYGTSEMANYRIQLMCDKIENRAFEAGRKSVIESASKLKWEEINLYRHCGIYLEVCRAHTRLEDFLIRIWSDPRDIELLSNNFLMGGFSKGGFKTVEEAKSYATKVYKERIKEVLEL